MGGESVLVMGSASASSCGLGGSGTGGVSSRGRRRIGTASRYGRISGSRLAEGGGVVPRFFHFDGVWLGWLAKREYGNGLLEGEEPSVVYAVGEDVVKGWR